MNSDFKFNLIDNSWIPVVYLSGHTETISIRKIFTDANDIRSLADPLATSRIATFRVLLAILYRAWEADQTNNKKAALDLWKKLWERQQKGTLFGESNGKLANDELQQYLAEWHHRFNLNDETAPFMQTKGMRTANNETKPLDILVPDGTGQIIPKSKSKPFFFMRTDANQLTADEAARFLIHSMAYDYSGIKSGVIGDPGMKQGKSYPMSTGVCGHYGTTLIEGRNLGETLLLNLVPHGGLPGILDDHDPGLPCWELPPPKPGKYSTDVLVEGQVSLLTWPQRRIELYWKGSRATSVLITNGDPVDTTELFGKETMTCWKWNERKSEQLKSPIYTPHRITRGRELWRSGNTLFPPSDNPKIATKKFGPQDKFKPSATSEWLIRLISQKIIDTDCIFQISRTSMFYTREPRDKIAFDDVVTDTIGLPGIYFSEEGGKNHRSLYKKALDCSEGINTALRNLAKNIHIASGGGEAKDKYLDTISSQFYHQIDPHFRRWLSELPATPAQSKVEAWIQVAKAEAAKIANTLLQEVPPQVWTSPRQVPHSTGPIDIARAEVVFRRALWKIESGYATQKEIP